MPFFHFSQNNSGGSFVQDGYVTHHVIVEAANSESADDRAQAIGIYFDGCDNGRDCSCCGDRWYRAYGKGSEEPEVYGVPPDDHVDMFCARPVVVHRLDGTQTWHGKQGTWAEQEAAHKVARAKQKELKKGRN